MHISTPTSFAQLSPLSRSSRARQQAAEPDPEAGASLHDTRFNTSGTYTTWRYSAASRFTFRKTAIHIPYNLQRGSAVSSGKVRDGSSIGDSPVIIPTEDAAVYDARDFLRARLTNDEHLAEKARRLCARHSVELDDLLHGGPDKVIWMDGEEHFSTYGDRQTYPVLKAIFAKQSFVIVEGVAGCGVLNGKFEKNFFDRLLELEAVSSSAIVVPGGLLVAAPSRLFLCVALIAIALTTAVLAVVFDDRPNFIERFESATFVLALVLLTVPAVVSLLSDEPEMVRNAVRGKKVLTKQSEVTRHYGLSRRDYAMLATRTKGSKLVSRDVGCYLTGDERGTHMGDVAVVQCEDLAPFGVICGQSVHYRTNWQTVCISNRLGANRTHLTSEAPKVKYWCAGVRQKTWVG